MRVSLNWLRELVALPPQVTVAQLAERLTVAGFEVEDIEDRRTWAAGVVVGRVLARQAHPQADKLSVCRVDVGQPEPLTIVCGAANVRAEALVPVALVGTYLPGIDLKIVPANKRGVDSWGMICSLAELGLAKNSEGIHIFDEPELSPGQDVRPLLGLDDVILEVASTANRADALSMVGMAREVAALFGVAVQFPAVPGVTLPPAKLKIDIPDPIACPRYWGTQFADITIAPSPLWLRQRLERAGTRVVNNVVDITNYVLLEWGQPLHAFDGNQLQKLAGNALLTLGVRLAHPGESLKTLDEQTRNLTPQTLVITANDQPVALAGVMGGAATEVTESTHNILLEAAIFDPAMVRRSARSLGLRTEASARYERGVNPADLALAWGRTVQLLQEWAGAKLVGMGQWDQRDMTPRLLKLRRQRVQAVLGNVTTGALTDTDIVKTLTALGFTLEPTDQGWQVTVPPYRLRDIEREIDLIEEVARLVGYDNFVNTLPGAGQVGGYPPTEQVHLRLRELCRGYGLHELMHYSLVKAGDIHLSNPLLAEYGALRTDLFDGLVQALTYNVQQKNGVLWGFEVGRVFVKNPEQEREFTQLGAIWGGSQEHWLRKEPVTWYEAKGLVAGLLQGFNLSPVWTSYSQDPRFHPGRTAQLSVDGKLLGQFGQLHPHLCQSQDIPEQVYVLLLDIEYLTQAVTAATLVRFQPYATYPASDRDLALFAGVTLTVADLMRVMRQAGGDLLQQVFLFDEYRGEGVPEGQRSLAFRLIYRAENRTLTDPEVEAVQAQVRQALVSTYSVTLRS
ncbi:phenylalanyl-tRNA synthetase subunit beta [Gloeomargarita lithophora Alchichica-D10]|uniref:Phenylalanine--tRNA ligase beta subunit n=1 Tax=Gloeomargarita lithophora Alchichica-D10 TaxID=1188229 RepID=A0A1J0AAE5_9CYAN|nr:phenylalanine--tRNA ligase subunit beta [Gloeomargarita lithophora]APB32907.1 phenylalanyl-tRNA synthetase subunit beta [Gloeomargarita lithophora Alchichica-D10]